MRLPFACLLFLLAACGGETEGDDAGECSDGADNDENGAFDCADPGCVGSPDCAGTTVPAGVATGLPTGTPAGTPAGTPTGTTTTTGTPTQTFTQFQIFLTWTDDGYDPTDTNGDGFPDTGCGDSIQVRIEDPAAAVTWDFGMAEDGYNGWTGEDCLAGMAGFNFCHPIGWNHTLNQVTSCQPQSIVEGSTTLFSAGADPFLTYFFDDGANCFIFGTDTAYYGGLGCTTMI